VIYNYDFDIAGLVFLTIGTMCLLLKPRLSKNVEKKLVILISLGYLYNLFDIGTAVMIAHPGKVSVSAMCLIADLYFLLLFYFPYAFLTYICAVTRRESRWDFFLGIPVYVNTFLLIFYNNIYHLYFQISLEKSYHLGKYIWLIYANWAFYILYMSVIVWKRRNWLGNVRVSVMGGLVSFSAVIAGLQIMLPDILLVGLGISLGIVTFVLVYHFLDLSEDRLTGLPLKSAFCRETAVMLKQYRNSRYILIRCDIHHFQDINEKFGWKTGDLFLCKFAELLRHMSGVRGTCGYLGADNFVFCVPEEEMSKCPFRIDVGKFLGIQEISLEVSCYFGVYEIETAEMPVDLMCDRAEFALNRIQNSYLKHYSFFDEAMELELLDERLLEQEMFDALRQKQFKVYYQPIFDLKSGNLVSAEALVRWKHPQRGLISPDKFIPLFERNGFISEMDMEITEQVCNHIESWKNRGIEVIPISVNVSRQDLNSGSYCDQAKEVLTRHQVSISNVMLEVTESAFTENLEQLLSCINKLRSEGFKILMDDFGSGYSSFNMFQNLPVDILKLDMKFLKHETEIDRGKTILESIVYMTKKLGIPVIVEGVENPEQADYLKKLECEEVQGFYFSRPMPRDEFEKVLIRGR